MRLDEAMQTGRMLRLQAKRRMLLLLVSILCLSAVDADGAARR
jgi:hypothetical protein